MLLQLVLFGWDYQNLFYLITRNFFFFFFLNIALKSNSGTVFWGKKIFLYTSERFVLKINLGFLFGAWTL